MIFEWVKHSYELKAAEHQSRNPYIEASLKYTLCVIEKIRGNIESIDVTLQADNDFYSQVHHVRTRHDTFVRCCIVYSFIYLFRCSSQHEACLSRDTICPSYQAVYRVLSMKAEALWSPKQAWEVQQL